MERAAVLLRDERVGVDGLALLDRDDHVDITRPCAFGVEDGSARGVVGMAVVVADDAEPRVIRLSLDANVVEGIDLIAVARALDDDVPRAPNLGYSMVALRAEHDPADLIGIALGAVCLDCFERRAVDVHLLT